MGYVKMDDGLPDHPKIAVAGPLAGWLYFCGIAYCNRLMTDGFIPAAQVSRLSAMRDPEEVAAILVAVHLWEPVEGGYRVHDYLTHQSSKEHILAVRAARQESGKRGGISKASNLLERQAQESQPGWQNGTSLLKQNPGKNKKKNKNEEEEVILESESESDHSRARAPGTAIIADGGLTGIEPEPNMAIHQVWWQGELVERAARAGVPLEALASRIDVADETARWNDYTGKPVTWRNWMRRSIDHALRDYQRDGARALPTPHLNGGAYGHRLSASENELRKLQDAAQLISNLRGGPTPD